MLRGPDVDEELGFACITLHCRARGYYAWLKFSDSGLPDGIAGGNGRIEATEIDISTKTAGRIQDILVNEGDFVEVGQVLARMDNFQRDVLAGRSPTIQLNIDATRISQAFTGGGYVQSIVSGEVNEFVNRYRGNEPVLVDLVLRARFNPQLDKGWFASINNVISSITMLSIILTGAALIREREHGTIEHLLVMPVTPVEIMLSKIWSMGLVVVLASVFSLVFIVQGLLDVPIEGSFTLFVIGTVLQVFAMTCMGIFLATVAGSMPQFGLLLMLVLIPLQLLSGGTTPRESMPQIIQTIMLAAPNTHFVILSQAVLFRGAGLSVVWPQLAVLFALGAIFFYFALKRFRQFLR